MRNDRLVLVADDSAEDIFILKHTFTKAHLDVPLVSVEDGEEAVSYLSGEAGFSDRKAHPLPSVLLLDLHMPRGGGFHVLRWLEKHEKLKRMPVIVLTSSDEQKDVDLAYDLGANSYLVKPHTLEEYVGLVVKVNDYWIGLNRCPNCSADH